FQPVGIVAQVVGVMDGIAREPQNLALELREDLQLCRSDRVSHVGFPIPQLRRRLKCAASARGYPRRNAAEKYYNPIQRLLGTGGGLLPAGAYGGGRPMSGTRCGWKAPARMDRCRVLNSAPAFISS